MIPHGTDEVPTTPSTPIPVPSAVSSTAQTVTVVVADDNAIAFLIGQLLKRSGLSQGEVARRLGISTQTLGQYRTLRRRSPKVSWLARLAAVCGAKLVVEFPKRPLE